MATSSASAVLGRSSDPNASSFIQFLMRPSLTKPPLSQFIFTKSLIEGRNLLRLGDEPLIRKAAISKGIRFSFPSTLVGIIEQICKELISGKQQAIGYYERLLMRYAQHHTRELAPLKMRWLAKHLARQVLYKEPIPQIVLPKSQPSIAPIATVSAPIFQKNVTTALTPKPLLKSVAKAVSTLKNPSFLKKIAGVAFCSLVIGSAYLYRSSLFSTSGIREGSGTSSISSDIGSVVNQLQTVDSQIPIEEIKQKSGDYGYIPLLLFASLVYLIDSAAGKYVKTQARLDFKRKKLETNYNKKVKELQTKFYQQLKQQHELEIRYCRKMTDLVLAEKLSMLANSRFESDVLIKILPLLPQNIDQSLLLQVINLINAKQHQQLHLIGCPIPQATSEATPTTTTPASIPSPSVPSVSSQRETRPLPSTPSSACIPAIPAALPTAPPSPSTPTSTTSSSSSSAASLTSPLQLQLSPASAPPSPIIAPSTPPSRPPHIPSSTAPSSPRLSSNSTRVSSSGSNSPTTPPSPTSPSTLEPGSSPMAAPTPTHPNRQYVSPPSPPPATTFSPGSSLIVRSPTSQRA